MRLDFCDSLSKVQWFSSPDEKTVLDPLGFSYGFAGFKETAPEAVSLKQVHGSDILDARASSPASEGDGLYLYKTPGTIAVKTADCLPLILASPEGPLVMVLHAGWRGLSGGIVQRALELAQNLLGSRSTLYAVLGPSISLARFEVGSEVVEAFCVSTLGLTDTQLSLCLHKGRGDRWHVDLTQIAVFILLNHGLAPLHISAMRSCTFDHPELWPSYRRDKRASPSVWTWVKA